MNCPNCGQTDFVAGASCVRCGAASSKTGDPVGATADQGRARVIAAVNFKGWHRTVWLQPGPISWPNNCACCGTSTEGRQPLEDLVYPLCEGCRRHARRDWVFVAISAASALLLTLSGYYAAFGFSWIRGLFQLTLALLLGAFAMITGAVYWCATRVFAGASATCADTDWPVAVPAPATDDPLLGKSTEPEADKQLRLFAMLAQRATAPGGHCLRFTNSRYFDAFLLAHQFDPKRLPKIS